ncbi:transcriptional repressor [Candidatus Kaiserbacteria bacterium]|nr:transcriptional repressor [Candidatus Kaiserbacteria bacterium]
MRNERSMAETIRDAGFRATKPRLALFSRLTKTSRPMSIQELAQELAGKVDQVTVYRMIDAFKKAGLVREVHLRGVRPKYELTDPRDDHHHIVCTECRKVEDFVGCGAEKMGKEALRQSRSFAAITGHTFDLYGLCKECITK